MLSPKELMVFLKGVNPGVRKAVNGTRIKINNAPKTPNNTPILISFIAIAIIYHNGNLYIKKHLILISRSIIYFKSD